MRGDTSARHAFPPPQPRAPTPRLLAPFLRTSSHRQLHDGRHDIPVARLERLDRLGALLVAAVFALLAWRTVLGGINAYDTFSGTMMLGFPEWVVYAAMVPPFVVCSLIGLLQALGAEEQGAQA